MKLRLLLILSLFAIQGIAGGVKAAADKKTYTFIVWTHDGGQVAFNLEDKPVVTYDSEEGKILVTSNNAEEYWTAAEVAKFTLSDEIVTSIAEVEEAQGVMKNKGNVLMFSSFEPGSRVQVYSVNGMLIVNEPIGADGNLELCVSDYPSGIYVVKAKGITCKIVKK